MNMLDKRKLNPGTSAIIYCRVSDTKQTTRGDGLNSQETRCREFAKYKGYEVVAVFKDDMSGKFHARPGMQDALSFLRKHRKSPHVLIIDDITRLARGLEAHIKLRADINGAGGILESPSIEFGEDSDSILVENLLASVSQHQRQKNGEQTKNRMRARLQNGYWPFQAPIGYRYERSSGGHGKILVRDEPNASILQEALEGYASGRFQTQVEVKRFLERQPDFPKDLNGREVRNQRAYEFLTRVLYAGYVEHADWGVSIRKGQHEGLIPAHAAATPTRESPPDGGLFRACPHTGGLPTGSPPTGCPLAGCPLAVSRTGRSAPAPNLRWSAPTASSRHRPGRWR
jgi:DNA invertase Pin-like site-specific DNA recombinase